MASLPGYAVITDHGGLQIQLYTAGEVDTIVDGSPVRTDYPWNGRVELTVTADTLITLGLRIPGWCNADDVRLDGERVEVVDGYVRLLRDWGSGVTVTLELPMPVRHHQHHRHPALRLQRDPAGQGRAPLRRRHRLRGTGLPPTQLNNRFPVRAR
jgi:DUF1680 family protein